MNILHYSLGFPPYRTGGMTKYCMDLIEEQLNMGNDVSLLWPGRIIDYSSNIDIRQNKKYKIKKDMFCNNFEIINPLPVPLLDGIKDINQFTEPKKIDKFVKLFETRKFDVIHVHTLMGLPKELLLAAKEMKIKLVYTAHDYFGLCTRGTFIFQDNICKEYNNCTYCAQCNENALSLGKIKIMQSHIYKNLKNIKIMKILRKKQRKFLKKNEEITKGLKLNCNEEDTKMYIILRKYYLSLLELFDIIHFNSSVTKEKYSKFIDVEKKGEIISISHGSIKDNKHRKSVSDVIRFSYLASCTKQKGIYLLKDTLDLLYKKYPNTFILNVYTNCLFEAPYLRKHDKYSYSELENVLNDSDLVIVPSMSETFGFTVLESLSYAVPVIVSTKTGAKDIVEDSKSGFIVDLNTKSIAEKLEKLIINKKYIEEMNKYIIDNVKIKEMKEHCKEMINLYNKI